MRPTPFALTLVLTLHFTGCEPGTTPSSPASGAARGVQAGSEAGASAADEHDHDHDAEGERSDLDRPLAELFAATCEHGVETHTCDECRYEVGVVVAPATLFAGGLLTTAKPERRAIGIPLQLTGEVQFDQRRVAHVSSQAEGIIRAVHVNQGDRVTRGTRLLEIESVAVGEAQASYLEARGLLELAERNLERKAELRKEGISSEKSLLEAEHELEVARIRVDTALGTLVRLGTSRGTAQALTRGGSTGRLVLRAPVDGTVLEIHAVAGEAVSSNESLATVGDNQAVWVWADIYERDLAVVSREQRQAPLAAAVSVKAFPEHEFAGSVDFISPSMSKKSRTAKLRVAVPNANGDLLAGMFATVSVFLPGEVERLTVPRCAVLADEGRSFLFIHHVGDYYVRRPVVVGRVIGDRLEIQDGLEGDETIVVDGAFLLKSDVLRSKMGAGCAD